ncbi:MAG TPA: glycosyltransferase [Bryobacteraceae bacterium]|nr:glycosyltransferase [Bryobacteraceae bacterium]
MKVGFLSPLPPARTGVADYSAALLRAMGPLGDIEVDARDAEVFLYHLGNNQLHSEIYGRAIEKPGVIVLHDACLHHFFLGSLTEAQYIDEFTYNYGVWNEDLARDLWRRRARSASDPAYFRYPMLKRVVERSLAVIVHNPGAAAMVREHVPGAAIHEIPHLFEPPEMPPPYDTIRLRRELGVPAQTFLFGVFGHLRESKRLAAVLRAFQHARTGADVALLIAGEFTSSDLERSIEPMLNSPGILRVGYTPERDFWCHAAAVDAVVNLRYPTAGETSGISIRLMGIGKPVLMSDGCETARFPDFACLKVDSGVSEEEMLSEYMVWLAGFPTDGRAIGERAAAHIREFHAPAKVARKYWEAIGCSARTRACRVHTL